MCQGARVARRPFSAMGSAEDRDATPFVEAASRALRRTGSERGCSSGSARRSTPLCLVHGDDDLALYSALFEIAHRVGYLVERESAVDYRPDLAGFDELLQDHQVLPADGGQERAHLLASESG